MSKLYSVKLKKAFQINNAGEICGFTENVVRKLLKNNMCDLVNDSDNDLFLTKKPEIEELGKVISSKYDHVLKGTKQDIHEAILEKDENGDHIINDTALGEMLFEERQNRNRKNVLKVIEDISFDRIKSR